MCGWADRAIYEINALPLKEAKAFFDQVKLTGQKLAIAEKIIKEISSRISVPQQCRARLPVAGSLRRDPVRRRIAAHPACQPDRLRTDRRDVRAG